MAPAISTPEDRDLCPGGTPEVPKTGGLLGQVQPDGWTIGRKWHRRTGGGQLENVGGKCSDDSHWVLTSRDPNAEEGRTRRQKATCEQDVGREKTGKNVESNRPLKLATSLEGRGFTRHRTVPEVRRMQHAI
ncbi:hypothetical protein NDU88_000389 [Pleurodeles waltl]|uniref:Uncharacterized protein n=1 Tax=Pleurodeles waltl TaxID=8319 RepID=A0AAV7KPB7_PLEWA|nr:hypothetical protein NDU88_000389 [Pleurodeles waltl]